MFKNIKMKLLTILIIVILGGCVMTKSLSMFHDEDATRKSQDFNIKENYTKNFLNVSENSDLKNIDLLSDDSQNNEDTITKKSSNSQLEESNNTNDKNNQKSTIFQVDESNSIDDMKNQKVIDSNLGDINNNSNVETESTDNVNDTLEEKITTFYYDRTTSIYANDNATLLRVEYYINNKLTYYSVIENFDVTTKSYTEKIYKCNRETNIDPLIRTDIYVNGNLVKSY